MGFYHIPKRREDDVGPCRGPTYLCPRVVREHALLEAYDQGRGGARVGGQVDQHRGGGAVVEVHVADEDAARTAEVAGQGGSERVSVNVKK